MKKSAHAPDSKIGLAILAARRVMTGRPGDFALLKAELFGAKPSDAVVGKLESVKGYRPSIDIPALSQLPENTFGRRYANWMIGQKLTPFVISEDLGHIADRNTLAMRYAITHDMIHVLTGFDTSYAGEIGVLSFAVAQDYSPQFKTGLKVASILYPFLSLGKLRSLNATKKTGAELGHRAKFLLGERLEDHFEDDLNVLRRQLNLASPHGIGLKG